MPFLARITIHQSGPGRFPPDGFRDLLQRHVQLPGLDPQWRHTLVDVTVADDGLTAEIVTHSEPMATLSLDRHLRLVGSTPPVRVRAVDDTGALLYEGTVTAPLRPGQRLELHGDQHQVTAVSWPSRDPHTSVCAGDIDWQVVTIVPAPAVASMPVEARA